MCYKIYYRAEMHHHQALIALFVDCFRVPVNQSEVRKLRTPITLGIAQTFLKCRSGQYLEFHFVIEASSC